MKVKPLLNLILFYKCFFSFVGVPCRTGSTAGVQLCRSTSRSPSSLIFYGAFGHKIEEFTWLQVIEIGKGSKVKYELDKKNGLLKVNLQSLLKTYSGLSL